MIKKTLSKIKNLDEVFHRLNEKYTEKINCLDCANCCKTLGPRLSNTDIERMAKKLKMKSSDFYAKYIIVDEDGDLIFKSMPCPFLDENNYCIIYEHRPKACREYPHCDRKNIKGILDITVKNAEYCPIVKSIIQEICIEK